MNDNRLIFQVTHFIPFQRYGQGARNSYGRQLQKSRKNTSLKCSMLPAQHHTTSW